MEASQVGPPIPARPVEVSQGWRRVAPWAGYIAAFSALAGALLFLLDALDVLADSPEFRSTAAGFESDLATYYVAYFERQHDILWSIVLRDVLLPVAFLALMVLSLAVASLMGWHRPMAQMCVLFFVVGGVLQIVSDVLYLAETSYWRSEGWEADPPGPMVAAGRASDAIDLSTNYIEAAGYVVLAAALVCLGLLCRSGQDLPRWLGLVAFAEAVGMLMLVVGRAVESDLLFQVGALAGGIVLGPLLFAALGRQIDRAVSAL